MFASLSHALSGTPSPAKAEHACREWFASLCTNLESKVGNDPAVALLKEADFQAAFFRIVSTACAACFKEPNKGKQRIALRHLIVECCERSHRATHYLSKRDEERQILSERFFSTNSKTETDQQCVVDSQLYNTAALVFKSLGGKYFDDFKDGDWFVVMSSSGRRLIECQMDTAIQKAQGSALLSPMEAALEAFGQKYKAMSAVVFSGANCGLAEFDDAPRPSEGLVQGPV